MNPDPIVEKIKKLLRMKRGGSQGEIENALALAAELARKHGIDLASVDPDQESSAQRITHVEDVLKLRIPAEAKYAAAILVNFFSVAICIRSAVNRCFFKKPARMVIVGTAWDCDIARYVFIFLQRHFRHAWNRRENRRLKNREAFMHGMLLGLAAKLEAQQPKGEGLILAANARKDYLAKLIPNAKDQNLTTDDSDASAAKYAGIVAGRKTEIRSGLNKTDAPQRPALPPAKLALTQGNLL
jgi:Protein of unknown function (DUF2786)